MTDVAGRIIVALNRQSADVLRTACGHSTGDIKTLIDAAAALGDVAMPLKTLLERQEYLAVTSAIPNKTRSVKDQVALEASCGTPLRRTMVGVFALNAAALTPDAREQLVAALRSLGPLVATAYVESSEAIVAYGAPSLSDGQTYLNAAPEGIGLKALPADAHPPGAGVGLAVIDKAWNLHHETLSALDQRLDDGQAHGFTETERQHGTSVLGLILSPPGKRIIGIAPGARLKALRTPPEMDGDMATNPIGDAINDAVDELGPGDVLLLEIQERGFLPVEVNIDSWNAIARATEKGIVVIEPAGNGGADLDQIASDKHTAPAWNWPDDADADSGAIIVSGCTSGTVHHRDLTCNQGDRVDCYAASQHVVTAGGESTAGESDVNQRYCDDFGGTSSASAIIAGVVLRMQALARRTAGIGRPLTPGEIRDLLRSPKIGTPISFDGKARYMPDLAKLPHVLAEFAARTTTGTDHLRMRPQVHHT